jgi:predicted esterase
MIIRRSHLGTNFAKLSAAQGPGGDRRCIVLGLHATTYDFSKWPTTATLNDLAANLYSTQSTWSSWNNIANAAGTAADTLETSLSDFGKAGFELLAKLVNGEGPFTALAGKIDKKRIYIAGVSSGGGGSVAMVAAHPNYFAAAYIGAPTDVWKSNQAQAIVTGGTAIWAIHGKDDPVVDCQTTLFNIARLKAANISETKLREQIIPSYFEVDDDMGPYGYSSAHSFGNTNADPAYIDWLFAQSRDADASE